jgi:hypothetical protein
LQIKCSIGLYCLENKAYFGQNHKVILSNTLLVVPTWADYHNFPLMNLNKGIFCQIKTYFMRKY